MGHTEQVCQICGIGFNIGRIRKHDEPESAAWDGCHGDYVSLEDSAEPCEAEGCSNVSRNQGADGLADGDRLEHIAGPNCQCTDGYSGWRISIEEMRERLQNQCLAVKLPDWYSLPGDEDFEVDANHCFLTRISNDEVSDFEVSGAGLQSSHQIRSQLVSNYTQRDDDLEDKMALPMHPRCFDMYKRMSLQNLGKVDIDKLWLLREAQGDHDNRFYGMPMAGDLRICVQQWYHCEPGTEYLAANPVDVPGLQELLQSCVVESDSTSQMAFKTRDGNVDVFARLSPELHSIVLGQLDRCDVANLRQASRSFSQLPQSYFHALVTEEMPWLWELDELRGKTVDWFTLWSRLHRADGGAGRDEEERHWKQDVPKQHISKLRQQIEDEGFSSMNQEFLTEFSNRRPACEAAAGAEIKAGYENGMWPALNRSNELRGLRNRRRIWGDLEIIFGRIALLPPEQTT